jgi:acyl-CoA synthetase (AMP-forming)/AMP-acid ligase II
MTLQLDAEIERAVIHGPPRRLMDGSAPTVIENIARRVAEAPDGLMRSFQSDGTLREQTFAEAWRRSGDIAARLRRLGVGPGSQTVMLLGDLLDFVPSFWASLRVGATPMPLSGVAHVATAEELTKMAARLERPALIADAPTPDLGRLTALLPDAPILRLSSLSGEADAGESEALNPDEEPDIICLLPTSGSTGTVKFVMLDRRAVLNRFFSQNYSLPSLKAHVLNVFPFEGVSGLRALFPNQASVTQLQPRTLTIRPLAIFEAIERFAVTIVQMTNSTAARLVEDAANEKRNFDLSSIKMVGLGGETVTRLVSTRFDALLRRNGAVDVLRAGYGTTETSSLLAGADPSTCPLDEAGAPILGGAAAGVSLRIVGDDGTTLGEGEAGHVEAFAPQTLFAGYWKEPELSRDCMTTDGWYKTGDLGAIEDGGFSFRGRAKQTLVVAGRKFSLDDIDACLQSDADVGRQTVSFVFRGGADATDGLGVAVAISEGEVLDSVSTDWIRNALLRRYGLAPTVLLPVRSGEWPLTATGKVDRRALAERAAKAGAESNADTASRAPERVDEEILAVLWREALNLARGFGAHDRNSSDCGDDFGRDDNFFDCRGDSLRAAALLISVDKRFKRQFALRDFFALPTFNNLLRLVEGASAAAAQDQAAAAWPLPQDFRRHFLTYVEGWSGERVSDDRLGRMFGRFTLAEIDGEHDVFLDNTRALAGELTRSCAQALDRSRPFAPLTECAFELAVANAPRRAQPGARLRLEVRVKNVGNAPVGVEHANLRLGGFWTCAGATHGPRFIDAAPLPAIAPGDVSVVNVWLHAPEVVGNFELGLDLFQEWAHALTGLGVGPVPAKIKVTRRATRMHDFLRSCFRPEKETVATRR